MEGAMEIMPGLFWCAEASFGAATERAEGEPGRVSLGSLTSADFFFGQYRVFHYPPQAYGDAFGPLSLGQVMRWCLELGQALEGPGGAVVEHGSDRKDWANSAVLLGAFLILRKGWSMQSLLKTLPQEAKFFFPCSWCRAEKSRSHVLRVEDCWAGLELAHARGWVQLGNGAGCGGEVEIDDSLMELAISQYYRMLREYDASWVAPGEVMVAADPMTCVMDPSPGTCPSLFPHAAGATSGRQADDELDCIRMQSIEESPQDPDAAPDLEGTEQLDVFPMHSVQTDKNWDSSYSPDLKALPHTITGSTATDSYPCRSAALDSEDGTVSRDLMASMDSVITVAKEYKPEGLYSADDSAHSQEVLDFTSFCRKNNVRRVVRANTGDEPGIREVGGSYDAPEFRRVSGIDQMDVLVSDAVQSQGGNGGMPEPRVLKLFLESVDRANTDAVGFTAVEGTEDHDATDGALLIHCKGGFGRSMMLALCLLISKHDVPGRALLGWARIARPGAITTPQQENFLKRIRGRADLYRAVGFQGQPGCCSMQ